jgi:murein DD-endopeptidase MepM/ murein hydrolase activator NlpD
MLSVGRGRFLGKPDVMNIIIFRRGGVAHHLSMSGALVGAALGIVGTLAGAGFVGGYYAAGERAAADSVAEVTGLHSDVVAQRQALEGLRENASHQLDALALKVGQLNANVIRMNALGRRLTAMAKLDQGEFDFDSVPAVGGPVEATLASESPPLTDLMAEMSTLDATLHNQEQQLIVLEGLLLNRKLHDRVYPKGQPVRAGWISSNFGRRTDPFTGKPASHRGVDFAGRAGTEVVAVAAGVVTYSGDRSGYGTMVEINHGNGYVTRYAHNAENLVAVGDAVAQGQTIALMGSTGRATGPNLHFEVRHLGRPVDPIRYIRETT